MLQALQLCFNLINEGGHIVLMKLSAIILKTQVSSFERNNKWGHTKTTWREGITLFLRILVPRSFTKIELKESADSIELGRVMDTKIAQSLVGLVESLVWWFSPWHFGSSSSSAQCFGFLLSFRFLQVMSDINVPFRAKDYTRDHYYYNMNSEA